MPKDDFTAWFATITSILFIILLIGYYSQASDLARIRVESGYCHGVLKAKGWDDQNKPPAQGASR